jgi:hypothetical protein
MRRRSFLAGLATLGAPLPGLAQFAASVSFDHLVGAGEEGVGWLLSEGSGRP